MDKNKVAKLLRDIQAEYGPLPEGVHIIAPDFVEVERICGLPIITGPTVPHPMLSSPASYKHARMFEDGYEE